MRKRRKITEAERQKAFDMFATGFSNQAVAEELGLSPAAIYRLRARWLSDRDPSQAEPEPNAADDPNEPWNIKLEVMPADLDRILLAATEQERANAVTFILQGRLNAILDPPATEEAES